MMKPFLLKSSSDDCAITGVFCGKASAFKLVKENREVAIAKTDKQEMLILCIVLKFTGV
jgi:hypothetical protein